MINLLTKGFTLIELLATIIIIGLITLITVPIVNNIIDNAEKSAEEANVKQYINALEDYLLSANTDENTMKNLSKNEYIKIFAGFKINDNL